ncbi:MAG: hypothetical protein ACXAC7_16880 [Candidatus Hodarchaeales archaeon]|jgi:hypothetical protein
MSYKIRSSISIYFILILILFTSYNSAAFVTERELIYKVKSGEIKTYEFTEVFVNEPNTNLTFWLSDGISQISDGTPLNLTIQNGTKVKIEVKKVNETSIELDYTIDGKKITNLTSKIASEDNHTFIDIQRNIFYLISHPNISSGSGFVFVGPVYKNTSLWHDLLGNKTNTDTQYLDGKYYITNYTSGGSSSSGGTTITNHHAFTMKADYTSGWVEYIYMKKKVNGERIAEWKIELISSESKVNSSFNFIILLSSIVTIILIRRKNC